MFRSARIKLTAWYLGIIMLITISFSVVFYQLSLPDLERVFITHERMMENRLQQFPRFMENVPNMMVLQEPINRKAISEIKTKIIANLVALNVSVLALSGLLGYLLAGITLRPIEETLEKQKTFVADAAHELKTPLTAMKTSLEVNARDPNLSMDTAKNIIKDTIKDINSLSALTNALLKEASYGNGDKNTIKEKISIYKIVQEAIDKQEIKAKEKNINIISNLEKINMVGNKRSMEDLINIILDNAIKFNKKDGTVEVNLIQKNNQIILSIKDTGIGIAKEETEHIFDRFYKADSSRNKKQSDGFGLGLSIAKQIVESYKGKIEVESKLNEGTTITIIFTS